MITYQRETVAQVRGEIDPLLQAHYGEIGQSDLMLNPDWDGYYANAEAKDMLFILTARCDGRLVGYNFMLLINHPHYKDAKVAQNDVIFVLPDYRRGKVGIGLIKHFETAMRGCGFDKIYYHAKPSNNFGALLERIGYAPVDTVYARHIGRDD